MHINIIPPIVEAEKAQNMDFLKYILFMRQEGDVSLSIGEGGGGFKPLCRNFSKCLLVITEFFFCFFKFLDELGDSKTFLFF